MSHLSRLFEWLKQPHYLLPVTDDGDPRYKHVIRIAEQEAEAELADVPKGRGFCHRFWGVKKRILREKYGLNWRSPADVHPAFYD